MQAAPRRYSKDMQEEIEKMTKALSPDVIEPCNSAFYSQVHMVWKKGGGIPHDHRFSGFEQHNIRIELSTAAYTRIE